MESMFTYSGLTILEASSWDTSNVTNMVGIFEGCSRLTKLNISNWNTSNVTNMCFTFRDCPNLTELDVSGWDTSNVTEIANMFADCTNLKTIYVSNKFTTKSVSYSDFMFERCNSLIGGNGTKYDGSHRNKSYARIDTPDTPGYFTYKAAPAPVAYAITAAPENGKLSVTLTVPAPATLSVVYFDQNGKFISVELVNVTPDDGTQSFEIASVTKTLLATLLDGDFRTLCEPFSVGL